MRPWCFWLRVPLRYILGVTPSQDASGFLQVYRRKKVFPYWKMYEHPGGSLAGIREIQGGTTFKVYIATIDLQRLVAICVAFHCLKRLPNAPGFSRRNVTGKTLWPNGSPGSCPFTPLSVPLTTRVVHWPANMWRTLSAGALAVTWQRRDGWVWWEKMRDFHPRIFIPPKREKTGRCRWNGHLFFLVLNDIET